MSRPRSNENVVYKKIAENIEDRQEHKSRKTGNGKHEKITPRYNKKATYGIHRACVQKKGLEQLRMTGKSKGRKARNSNAQIHKQPEHLGN